jgi:hypothetical protein
MIAESLLQASCEAEADTKTHVVAILPRGEAIRNFVYSGALDEVARKAKVSLISIIPNSDLEASLKSRYESVYRLQQVRERWIVRIQREILDMAHGRWLWSAASKERWRLRDLEATDALRWFKRRLRKIACYPFANRAGLALLSKLEQASSRWFSTTDQYVRLLKQIEPSLVFNGSHVHSTIATPVVQAAQWLGIPTATFIFSWDNLTSQGRIMEPYDYYLVWSEAIRDQLLQVYDSVRPDQVLVTGTPQFDFHFNPEFYWTREEFCARVGADPTRPVVLYTTGIAHHMPGEPQLVEGIANLLKEMTDFGPPQLLVRVYPKDRTNRFEELRRKRADILFPDVPWEREWFTPKFEDSFLLTNMLRHTAVGINVASTVSLELCMFDKPVINVGYNPPGMNTRSIDYRRYYDFDHYRPVVESGAIRLAESEEEMCVLLRQALIEPQAGSAERRALIQGMFGDSLDRHSAERVAGYLLKMAEATRDFV